MSTWKLEAEEHAKKHFPVESCGLVLIVNGKEKFWPCKNVSQYGHNFIMDPEDYATGEDLGEVIAIWHSHCGLPPKPSEADLVSCERSGLEWYIYSTPMNSWYSFKPSGYKAPLIGRQYTYGVLDCYSLARDWYAEQGIILEDIERKEGWWHRGETMFEDNFRRLGFEETTELEPGVGILMQIKSPIINHSAIYLGDDLILHHAFNRLSSRDVYGGMYKKNTVKLVRYVKRD